MAKQYDEQRLFRNATTAYLKRFGFNANQPASDSGVEVIDGRDCFVLRNVNGPFAIYHIVDGERLRFLNVA
jgi:hypothetical protein